MDNQGPAQMPGFCYCQAKVLFSNYRRIAAKIESLSHIFVMLSEAKHPRQ